MSQYVTYSHDAPYYDGTRVAIGLELILGTLAQNGVPLEEQSVLDAGCGTGNYLHALSPFIGSLTGVDSSKSMLEQARGKLSEDVALIPSSVLDLPLEDESFDGVICNQIIHHLEAGPLSGDNPADWPFCEFANTAQFFAETRRVLRRGGTLIVNFSQPVQVREGFWWASLIPTAVERITKRLPTLERLNQMVRAAGLDVVLAVSDLHSLLQGCTYFDAHGPLKDSWRSGDSTWSLASDAELKAAQQRIERMHRDGVLGEHLEAREVLRRRVGQTTFVCAKRGNDDA